MEFKVGVVGAGGMLQHHLKGFRQAGAEVVALCDVNTSAAEKAAEQWQIPEVYGDPGEMLDRSGIDAVSIIVPNKYHAPLSIQALNAGKHVFCEKPPALNATEVQQMIDAANSADRMLMFNFNNRARPEAIALKKMAVDGELGTINSAQARWIRRTGIPGFGGWFTTRALSGGGPVIDLLHMIDLALYLMDFPEPAHVLARTFDTFINDKTFKGPWGIPDNDQGVTDVEAAAHGAVTFDTGQILSFQVSWAELVKREEVSVVFQGTRAGGKIERLFGTDGLDDTAIDTCEIYRQENGQRMDQTVEVESCPDMGRSRSAANFVRAVQGLEQPFNRPDEALKLMKIIDAVYASSEQGGPVSL